MCPECSGTDTRVINASHDPEGNRIRRRGCEGCGHKFATVEVPFPFSFHEADDDKRHAPAYSSRIKVSEYEPSWFSFEPTNVGKLSAMTVVLRRSNKMRRCRKGIHVMRGQNVYRHPNGNKVCNACRRESANARYRNAMAKAPPTIREEINAQARERKRRYTREQAAREGREVQSKYANRYSTDEERREAKLRAGREAKRRAYWRKKEAA